MLNVELGGGVGHRFVQVVVVLFVDLYPAVAKLTLILLRQGVAVTDDDKLSSPFCVLRSPFAISAVAAHHEVGLAEGLQGHRVRREVAGGQDYDMLSFFHRRMPKIQNTSKTA